MLIRIDLQDDEPIYAQIVRGIRRALGAGDVVVGDRMPPARELAGSLGVNMHTVLRAYAELRDDGILEMRRGRGAVVVKGLFETPSDVREAVTELIARARRHGLPMDELHQALDEGIRS